MIADFPCVLPEFFKLVDPGFELVLATEGAKLFPRAVAMPGWMHLWDLVIRKGLCNLRYFPEWLVGLKAIVAFMRKRNYLEVLVRSLRQRGLGGAVDLLKAASLPSFADWRWGTLRACCVAVLSFIDALRMHFDAKLFVESREGTEMRQVLAALRSDIWRRFLDFVAWYCAWLGDLMSWGQGCACHGASEGSERCPWKGRRLREAHAHATAALRRGLEEANQWCEASWGCGTAWLDMQACVRGTFSLATRKIRFMDRIPYLLAKLGQPGVKAQCNNGKVALEMGTTESASSSLGKTGRCAKTYMPWAPTAGVCPSG